MRIDIQQLEFIDSKLRKILMWIETSTGQEFTITSLYRIGDKGVHGVLPLRGADLRMRNRSVGRGVVSWINSRWKYNPASPGRECALLHGDGGNLHIHVQVHANTIQSNNWNRT